MITLGDIEKAVRANFTCIEKENAKGGKLFIVDLGKRCARTAQIIFTGISVEKGHDNKDIQRYLSIGVKQYNANMRRFHEMIEQGKSRYEEREERKGIMYVRKPNKNLDVDVFVYRKTVLVNNYLKSLQQQRKSLELF